MAFFLIKQCNIIYIRPEINLTSVRSMATKFRLEIKYIYNIHIIFKVSNVNWVLIE